MAEKRKDSKGRILRDKERQRPEGKYEYRYWYMGQRCSLYSWKLVSTDKVPEGKPDELSLREKIKALERDLADGIDTSRAARTSMNQLFQMYLDSKAKLKKKTRETYLYLWKLHVENSRFGTMMIADIKKANVTRFYSDLSRDHSDATIRMFHNNLIRPSLEYAVDNDMIRKNPAKGCLDGYDGARRGKP